MVKNKKDTKYFMVKLNLPQKEIKLNPGTTTFWNIFFGKKNLPMRYNRDNYIVMKTTSAINNATKIVILIQVDPLRSSTGLVSSI